MTAAAKQQPAPPAAPADPPWFAAGIPVLNYLAPSLIGTEASRTLTVGQRLRLGVAEGVITELRVVLNGLLAAKLASPAGPGVPAVVSHALILPNNALCSVAP